MSIIGGWFRKPADQTLREEIEAHLAMRADYEGITLDEARKRFGNELKVQEDVRQIWIGRHVESWLQDVRLTLRSLRRHKVFAIAAVTALTVGLGASSAVFSVVDRVLFRAMPYPDAGRLVQLGQSAVVEPAPFLLWPDYNDWKRDQSAFSSMTATGASISDCDINEENPRRVTCAAVAWDFLRVLGLKPQTGRDFVEEDDRRGAPRVALITGELWTSRFGRDPGIVGRTLAIDGQPTRVVGVLPDGFEMPRLQPVSVLFPLALVPPTRPMPGGVLRVFARLKPGVTVDQAKARLKGPFDAALQYIPAQFRREVRLSVIPLEDARTGDARRASWLLLAAVAAVLLIACGNVSALMLARAESREREMAVRSSLGATRGRLLRLVLVESLVLSLSAGLAGIGLAALLVKGFAQVAPDSIPQLTSASIDWRVWIVGMALALMSGLICALTGFAATPAAAALHGARTTAGKRIRLREFLLAGQVAGTLVLLTAAGWLLTSLWQLTHEQLGLDSTRVYTAGVMLPQARYSTPAAQHAMWGQFVERFEAIPGVESVAVSDSLPPGGRSRAMIYSLIRVDGQLPKASGTGGMVPWRSVSPDYFRTLGIPIVSGRAFSESDLSGPHVMILSRSLERKLMGGLSALGHRIRTGAQSVDHEVIGIASDVRNAGLAVPAEPEYYVVRRHDDNAPLRHSTLIVRSSSGVVAAPGTIRREIAAMDPTIPIEVLPMDESISELASRPRLLALVLALFAATAASLAAIGMAGVSAYQVVQRRREIGIRLTLGATPQQARSVVLWRVLPPVVIGLVSGCMLSAWSVRLAEPLLHKVSPQVWITASALLMAAVAAVAAWIPACAAARVDPQATLRAE